MKLYSYSGGPAQYFLIEFTEKNCKYMRIGDKELTNYSKRELNILLKQREAHSILLYNIDNEQ